MRDLYTVSEELQYMSLDKPNVLTILILRIKVSFLFSQLIRTLDLCDTVTVFYQLSLQANWEQVVELVHIKPMKG